MSVRKYAMFGRWVGAQYAHHAFSLIVVVVVIIFSFFEAFVDSDEEYLCKIFILSFVGVCQTLTEAFIVEQRVLLLLFLRLIGA